MYDMQQVNAQLITVSKWSKDRHDDINISSQGQRSRSDMSSLMRLTQLKFSRLRFNVPPNTL